MAAAQALQASLDASQVRCPCATPSSAAMRHQLRLFVCAIAISTGLGWPVDCSRWKLHIVASSQGEDSELH